VQPICTNSGRLCGLLHDLGIHTRDDLYGAIIVYGAILVAIIGAIVFCWIKINDWRDRRHAAVRQKAYRSVPRPAAVLGPPGIRNPQPANRPAVPGYSGTTAAGRPDPNAIYNEGVLGHWGPSELGYGDPAANYGYGTANPGPGANEVWPSAGYPYSYGGYRADQDPRWEGDRFQN
jgi:hypothetical protein